MIRLSTPRKRYKEDPIHLHDAEIPTHTCPKHHRLLALGHLISVFTMSPQSQSPADMQDQIEAIPGTVHLVDSQGNMNSQHARGAERDIVLVPAPSAHPDDPLNWSPRRKYLSAFCMAAYVGLICDFQSD